MKKKLILSMDGIHSALELRFQHPEWVLLHEVRNKTGYSGARDRYADSLAFNTYPSRGLELHGIEIKRSRSDWKKELNSPDKSAPIQKFCDRWWVVVGDESIVWPGELPPTWGLLVPYRDGVLKCKTQAPKLEAQELTKGFVMSVFRSFGAQYTPNSAIREKLNAEYERGKATMNWQAKTDRSNLVELMKRIAAFEESSGIKIDSWRPGRVGESVKALMSLTDDSAAGAFSALRRHLMVSIKALDEIEGITKAVGNGDE